MDLQISTGIVEYTLHGVMKDSEKETGEVKISFNPTDAAFAGRILSVFDSLDKKQDEYNQKLKTTEPRDVFAVACEIDRDMREMLDGVFGVPVCDALFGTMNVYATGNNIPVWCNLLFAVLDVIQDGLKTAGENMDSEMDARVRKYTAKYKR